MMTAAQQRRAKAKRRAQVLRHKRSRSGVRRQLLAQALGVAFSTLWRWEHGRNTPSLAQVQFWEDTLARIIARRQAAAP